MSGAVGSPLRAVRYDPDWHGAWDACVRAARNGHFMFERAYIDYHADRFSDHSILFLRGSRVMGVLPAHSAGNTLCSHRGLPFAGLVVSDGMRLAETRAAFRLTLDLMEASHLDELEIAPVPAQYCRAFCDEQLWTLLELGALRDHARAACVLRIGDSPGPGRRRAQAMRGSLRKRMRVSETDDVPRFMSMLRSFLERIGGRPPVHSTEEMRLLKNRFPEGIRILVATWHDSDDWLCAQLYYRNDRCLRLQYSADTPAGRAAGACLSIVRHLLEAPDHRGRLLDFGTSMDPGTGRLDDLLVRHKESFGARLVLQSTYRLRPVR